MDGSRITMRRGKFTTNWIFLLLCTLLKGASSDRITCDTYPGGEVCYTVSDAAMGWDEAFEYCRNLTPEAGILASVYNIELQNRLVEVLENISTPIWISGKTEDPELLEANTVSQWRWVYDCDRCETMTELQQYALEAQGCYKDWDSNPDLRFIANETGSNVTSCRISCSKYDYAGLQMTQKCSCDNTFGDFGTIDGCIDNCGGNCGGYGRNFIYRLGGQFSVWANDQPDNAHTTDGTEFCSVANLADVYSPIHYRYFDEDCAKEFPYICSFARPCKIEEADSYYNTTFGTCVYISNTTEVDTWHRARTACWAMGGDLVTFRNITEHQEVLGMAASVLGPVMVYIGLYREAIIWKRAYREVEMNYYNFSTGQPNISQGSCLVMDPGDGFMWRTSDCAARQRAVCYQGPDMDPPPTTTRTTVTTKDTTITSLDGVTLIPPTNPDQSKADTLDKTATILLGVLIPVGVIIIIILIVILIRFCQKDNKSTVATTTDTQKDKIDVRLQASKPQSSHLGEVDDGYFDMGSTANLIYTVKEHKIPKKSSMRQNADIQGDVTPNMIRRNHNEVILIPDFTTPEWNLESGKYEYVSPQNSSTYLTVGATEEIVTMASNSSLRHLTDIPTYTVEPGDDLSAEMARVESPDVRYDDDVSVLPTISELSTNSVSGLDLSPRDSDEPLLDQSTSDDSVKGGQREVENAERSTESGIEEKKSMKSVFVQSDQSGDETIHRYTSEERTGTMMGDNKLTSNHRNLPPVV